jgi:hypothetical protein
MAKNSILPAVQFARALEAAGVVTDLDSIQRIVIDVNPAELVTVYVQRVAGPELKEAAGLLGEMMRDGRAANPDADAAGASKLSLEFSAESAESEQFFRWLREEVRRRGGPGQVFT